MRKTLLVILGLLVLFGFGVFFYYWLIPGRNDVVKLPFSSMRVAGNAIYVSDQKPLSEIRVGFAVMAEGGYVVIHDDEEGPGRILGRSGYLPPGETQNFYITLSAKLPPGYYYAMLHSDNGDGRFNLAEDGPIKDEQGNVMMMRFLVSEEAENGGAIVNP